MRLVSWNMAYWKPGGFNSVANRKRQWAFLAALAPDVALLQECRPDDLAFNAPEWLAKEYEVIGAIPPRWTACSAILARRSLDPQPFDATSLPASERRWREYLSGYVAGATVDVDGVPLLLASVHGVAKEVLDECMTEADHGVVRRSMCARAWHNDLAAACFRPWVEGQRFAVGGDWNTARLFDVVYPEGAEHGAGAGAEFFAVRDRWGWRETLRKFHPEEIQTYLDPVSRPYELDHLFTDGLLHDRLSRCDVLNGDLNRELSDHAPLVADFDL